MQTYAGNIFPQINKLETPFHYFPVDLHTTPSLIRPSTQNCTMLDVFYQIQRVFTKMNLSVIKL